MSPLACYFLVNSVITRFEIEFKTIDFVQRRCRLLKRITFHRNKIFLHAKWNIHATFSSKNGPASSIERYRNNGRYCSRLSIYFKQCRCYRIIDFDSGLSLQNPGRISEKSKTACEQISGPWSNSKLFARRLVFLLILMICSQAGAR